MPGEEANGKKTRFIRLPRISPVSRLLLFVGAFLIVAIPLFLIYSSQQAKQVELNQQYSILQKALGKQEPLEVVKNTMEDEIGRAKQLLDTDEAIFPSPDQIPEIIDSLMELAKSNGVEITKTQVATSRGSISIGADVLEYPVVGFDINLRGQVPKFQNFLLALNGKFPTSKLKKVDFKIPESEEEEDTANIVLNVYSSEVLESAGGEIPISGKKTVVTFSDKKDVTTESFKIKNSKWRIDWKATASDVKWSGFTLIVYRKGETGRYVEIISKTGGNPEGTSYIYQGGGDFYIKVTTANIGKWEIKIYE